MRKIITRAIIILYIMASVLLAQNYGKIYGTITDAETNQALPDSRVIFTENDWNMATDTSGFYILMPLPMGTYSISITCPGYQNLTIEKIQVISNEGTRIDIALTPGQSDSTAIVIQAREQWATESIPYSYSRITADDIQRLPVRGLQNYLELQPGVVIQDEQVHIRGGRSDETGYFVNGLSTTNPLDNSNAIYIIPEAIEQIRILPGIYSARYGGANSGIVLTDLKRGTADYRFSFNYQTDKFAKVGKQFLDTYSYRDQIVTATASGPLYFDNLRFFAAVENSGSGDAVKRFSKGFSFNNLVDDNPMNLNVLLGNPDTVSLIYPDGFTPFNSRSSWAVNSVLDYQVGALSANLTMVYNWAKVYENNRPMMSILNLRQQYLQSNRWLIGADFTYRFSNLLYTSIGFGYFSNQQERFDDWFGNDWQTWGDSARVADFTNGSVRYRHAFGEPHMYWLDQFQFYSPGRMLKNYLKSSCAYTDFHGTVAWQYSPNLHLQAGWSWRGYTLRSFSVYPGSFMSQVATYGWDEDQLRWSTNNIYGYDIHGNELESGINGAREPVHAAGFLEFRWMTNNTILDAGIRIDYLDTDDRSLESPMYQYITELNHDAWHEKEAIFIGNPRLSIITKMSDRAAIHFAYAKTVQPPALHYIYYDTYAVNRQILGGYYYLKPVGFDMNLMHSQHVDFGFAYWFNSRSRFFLNGFYKKTRGQPRSMAYVWEDPNVTFNRSHEFFMISNGDYAITRGIAVGLSVIKDNGLSANLNYTYTSAQGTGSNATSNYISVYNQYNRYHDTTAVNISFNPLDFEIKHTFLFNLNYHMNQTFGKILKHSTINLLIRLQSGHPYTHIDTWRYAWMAGWSADYEMDRRSNQAQEPINRSTTPWIYQIDFSFEKTVSLSAGLKATLFFRILNVFNVKNVINVYTISNAADSDGILTPQERNNFTWLGDQFYDLYDAINLKNGQSYWQATGKQLYGHPRQILLGLRLAY